MTALISNYSPFGLIGLSVRSGELLSVDSFTSCSTAQSTLHASERTSTISLSILSVVATAARNALRRRRRQVCTTVSLTTASLLFNRRTLPPLPAIGPTLHCLSYVVCLSLLRFASERVSAAWPYTARIVLVREGGRGGLA